MAADVLLCALPAGAHPRNTLGGRSETSTMLMVPFRKGVGSNPAAVTVRALIAYVMEVPQATDQASAWSAKETCAIEHPYISIHLYKRSSHGVYSLKGRA